MANPADKPRDYRAEIEAILDEMVAAAGGDASKLLPPRPQLTAEELARMEAKDEEFYAEVDRHSAAWRAAHPGEEWILASDVLDEDRGPR